MLIKTGYPNPLQAYDIFVLTWWIINEFENSKSILQHINLLLIRSSDSMWKLMHLSAAIPGGWPRGTPEHLHQDICKFHLQLYLGPSIRPQKATTVPPPGNIIWKDSRIVT